MASSLHQNFYEDWQPDISVQEGIDSVKELVEQMEALRAQPVKPSVVTDEQQWRRLTALPRQRS